MPGRTHGKVYVTVWGDPAYRKLPMDAQWLYEHLVSQPDLSLAGVLPLSPRRWSKASADADLPRMTAALHALEVDAFVVVDEDTEEILVRSFARRETQWTNHKMVSGFLSALDKVHSPVLVNALVRELGRVPGLPDRVADALAVRSPDPSPDRTVDPSPDLSPDPSPGRSLTRAHVEKGEGRREKGEPPTEGTRAERATRLPASFTITDDMWAWAIQQAMPVEFVERATAKFVAYWTSAPGARGRKLDWTATWRLWLMNEVDRGGGRPAPGVAVDRRRSTTEERVGQALALVAKYQAIEAQEEAT